MNYLIKNSKGIGIIVLLLCVMLAVNYTLEQKEKKVQDVFRLMVPTMLHKIKSQCDNVGGFVINGTEYICIPKGAV